jgi:hypothetical protein
MPCAEPSSLVSPHSRLRKVVGSIGIMLPLILIVGDWVSSRSSPPGSISGYYYTNMRDVLVGGLCSLGICLLACRGAGKADRIIIAVAGSCVVLVAFCPTKPLLGGNYRLTAQQDALGDLHDAFAITAFIALALIALRFARTGSSREAVIYRSCAGVIFCCVLLAPFVNRLSAHTGVKWSPLLINEVLAMWASGLSWFVSGCAWGIVRSPRREILCAAPPTHGEKFDFSEISGAAAAEVLRVASAQVKDVTEAS